MPLDSFRIGFPRAGLLVVALFGGNTECRAQSREAEFIKLAAQIVQQRQAGREEKEGPQEQALAVLDQMVIAALNGSLAVEPVNTLLQHLRTVRAPVGESYRLIKIAPGDASWPSYALAVNFSLSGPSAIRLYAPGVRGSPTATDFKLAARIDRFSHPDYFDEYLELVVVNPGAGVFVTVTGRTDDRKTGMFMAWRFDGRQLQNLWTSDLLENSSYEAKDGEFRLEFCFETDEEKPVCKKMARQRFAWDGSWIRKAHEEFAPKTPGPPLS